MCEDNLEEVGQTEMERIEKLLDSKQTPEEYVQVFIDTFSDRDGGYRNDDNSIFIMGNITALAKFGYITNEQYLEAESMLEEYGNEKPNKLGDALESIMEEFIEALEAEKDNG